MTYFNASGFEVKLNETTQFLDKTGALAELQKGNEPYIRPDWLYPHQEKIIEYMKRGNCLVKGMRQLTGKTTATHVANLEEMIEIDNSRTACMTTSIDHSKELFVRKINDPLLWAIFAPRLKLFLKESMMTHNNSKTEIYPMKVSAVQGGTAHRVWIDEFDKVVAEPGGREALAALLPQLLTTMLRGQGKLWITCNQGLTRQFAAIEKVLAKLGAEFFPVISIEEPANKGEEREFIITNEHVPSPNWEAMTPREREDYLKTFMYEVLTALADEQFAKAMILNLEDWSADPFPPELIEAAFQEPWKEEEEVIAHRRFTRRELVDKPDYFKNVVMYVDPGFSHATGVLVVGYGLDGIVYQLYANEFHGGEISEDDLKALFEEVYREYHVRAIYFENNSGGTWWASHCRTRGMVTYTTGFGTANPNTGDVTNATKHLERSYYERVLKDLMEKNKIRLASKVLRGEMDYYDPDENKEKGKGDLMDCLLQASFYVVGGHRYLMEMAQAGLDDDEMEMAYAG